MRAPTLVIATILLALLPALASVGNTTNEPIRSRIQLIPPDPDKSRSSNHSEYMAKQLKDEALVAVASTAVFPNWKTFEDDFVKFCYPDHKHIGVETKGPEEKIPIRGSEIGSSEFPFFQGYRITLGEYTYAVILLDRTGAFDDDGCFCGAVVYQKYLFHNSSLFRFDIMEEGSVKKVQVLNNGLRITRFEWTHLPLSQEAYIDLALSMEVKRGPCDQTSMHKAITEKYGLLGRLGFLEKGMSRNEIVKWLGSPARSSATALWYSSTDDYWKTTIRIDLEDAEFKGFGKGWRDVVEIPAGTELTEDSESTEGDLGTLEPSEAVLLGIGDEQNSTD